MRINYAPVTLNEVVFFLFKLFILTSQATIFLVMVESILTLL